MHIEKLEIERFGGLQQVVIKDLGQGIEVIHGTNEIGKTSLLEFIRGIFFGFESLFSRGVLDPTVPCSGRLIVATGKGPRGEREQHRYIIERRHEGPNISTLTKASYEDEIVGIGGDEGDLVTIKQLGGSQDEARRIYLQDVVGDIDETTFTNVMAFGLDELHELRTLEPEGCGSRLYELANGLDRSKVAETIRQIDEAIQRLEQGSDENTSRHHLVKKRNELQEAANMNSFRFLVGDLFIKKAQIQREIVNLEKALTSACTAEKSIREAVPISQLRNSWREAVEELESLRAVALVHPDYDGWQHDVKKQKNVSRLVEKRKKERRRLARELASIDTESPVWRKRVEITSLLDDRPQIERLLADATRIEAHARLAARRFGEQVGLCGLTKVVSVQEPKATDDAMGVLLPEGLSLSFGPLRSRARSCKRASRAVARARKKVASAKSDLLQSERQIEKSGGVLDGPSLTAAIEAATEQSSVIRKRIRVGERVTELQQTITLLEKEMKTQLVGQVMPLTWILGLGSIFVVGAGMLLSGLLLPSVATGPLAYVIAALGLAGTGVASVLTWSLDKSSGTRLEETRRQHSLASKQHDDMTHTCDTLDTKISKFQRRPASFGSELSASKPTASKPAELQPDGQLSTASNLERSAANADSEIIRLEHLSVQEGSLHSRRDQISKSKELLTVALIRKKKTTSRWQASLERRGLPSTLSPSEVWRISTHRHELLTLDDDRRRLSDEARHTREELAAASRRIEMILVDCELIPEGTALDQLQQLEDLLNKQRHLQKRKKICTRKLEKSRTRHRQSFRQLKACDRVLKARLEQWSSETEEEFLEKVDRRPYFKKLEQKARIAERTWQDGRSRFIDPSLLDRWIDHSSEISLDQRLSDAEAATTQLQEGLKLHQNSLLEIRGKIQTETKNNGPENKQRQLTAVQTQIAAHDKRIDLLKRTRQLLERTRVEVARHHQPAALIEASHWLSRLTEGRYTQITTAADEARLDVHDTAGVIWNPERLSRGTREQVFLALRLALIRDLHEQGITLPTVMDDALVNFDDQRAQAASRTLAEFMNDRNGDQQMLVLTCHAHVAALFQEAQATVRTLGTKHLDNSQRALTDTLPQQPWRAEEFFFGDTE